MCQIFTVITDNGGGPRNIYHDITGQIYTFPPKYRTLLLPGTKVVYHRAAAKKAADKIPDSLSDESHYFGIAQIGNVDLTDDGNYRATIINYVPFKYPVNIHRPDGEYYEGPSVFFQQGVRKINQRIYDDIKAASEIAPTVTFATKKNKGHRSMTVLKTGLTSGAFSHNSNRYEVVTGKQGYYLKSTDHIFYELKKIPKFENWNTGNLKVLKSINNNSFLILHDNQQIGTLTSILNGMKFSDTKSTTSININM